MRTLWIVITCLFLAVLVYVSGMFEEEDFTEAHDLYWGDGVYLNPIQHERELHGQTNSR